MQKKSGGGGPVEGVRSGVRMDMYVELKLLGVVEGRGLVGSKVGGSG